MERFDIRKIFFPEKSDLGEKKKELISCHQIICPRWLDIVPHFRTTWEKIQYLIATDKEANITQLRLCKKGKEAADKYASVNVQCPLEVFTEGFVKGILPTVIDNYRPNNGFDMDVFLLLDDMEDPKFFIEIFPRKDAGKMVTAYCSVLHFDFPMMAKTGEELSYALAVLITAERHYLGDSTDKILDDWTRHLGRWYVIEEETIRFLLDKATFSAIESSSDEIREMVESGVVRNLEGQNLEALFRFTTSK